MNDELSQHDVARIVTYDVQSADRPRAWYKYRSMDEAKADFEICKAQVKAGLLTSAAIQRPAGKIEMLEDGIITPHERWISYGLAVAENQEESAGLTHKTTSIDEKEVRN